MNTLIIAGTRSLWPSHKSFDHAFKLVRPDLTQFEKHLVVQGGAMGVDLAGKKWAIARKHDWITVPPVWEMWGKKAGIIRNIEMVEKFKPDYGIIFWDGQSRGTKHTIGLLQERAIPHIVMVDHTGTHANED